MIWLAVIGIALLVSGSASYILVRYRGRWSVLDQPNPRSLHSAPVPRTGGLAILLAIMLACIPLLINTGSVSPLLSIGLIAVALVVVAGVSLLDDIRDIGVVTRLGGQLAAALLVISAGLYINTIAFAGWYVQLHTLPGIVLAILFIVWSANLYNFMDGLDGLAAGMGMFGFGSFALLGALAGDPGFSLINGAIAAACLGFLLWNFPPARIFMGDAGAVSLGFLAAVLTLWANQQNIFPLWIGVAVFSPFIVDATWTLMRRIIRGAKPWEAHREHFYQRLVLAGWGRRKLLLCEYGLMTVCSVSALGVEWSARPAVEWATLGVLIVIYIALVLGIKFVETGRNTSNAVR
ncbi:MAG: glycosyltransferase family 4 protein [Gammaproteobacteria bacterium]